LGDEGHVSRSREVNRVGRNRLTRFLGGRGAEVVPSEANFVLARVGDGDGWFEALLDHGVIVRCARSFGMPEWIRVTVGLPEELDVFEEAFDRVLEVRGGLG
jgi:histidinol-phosphate aminotransferase